MSHLPHPYVTISEKNRYLRVSKPRISLGQYGIWHCRCGEMSGCAYDPASAYNCWHRNHFFAAWRNAQTAKSIVSGGIS